jgi:CRISPR-associated protein Cas2
MRRHYLVCYDIRDARRLRRVHRIVRNFGPALQYSVFACRLTDSARAELERRLLEVIDTRADNVMLVDLGPVASVAGTFVPGMRVLGSPNLPEALGVVVI